MPINHQTDDRGRKKTLILLGALLVALAGVIGYNLVQSRRLAVKPVKRTASDFTVTWRCLACGHTLEDKAGTGPRECPKCGKPEVYVSFNHLCAKHGVFPVAFQYDERGSPTEVKVADEPWVPQFLEEVEDEEDSGYNVRCPKCGGDIYPVAP